MLDAVKRLDELMPRDECKERAAQSPEVEITAEAAAKEICSILFDKLLDLGYLCLVIIVKTAADGRVMAARLGGTIPRKVDALHMLERECEELRAEVARDPGEQFEEEVDLGPGKVGLDS